MTIYDLMPISEACRIKLFLSANDFSELSYGDKCILYVAAERWDAIRDKTDNFEKWKMIEHLTKEEL